MKHFQHFIFILILFIGCEKDRSLLSVNEIDQTVRVAGVVTANGVKLDSVKVTCQIENDTSYTAYSNSEGLYEFQVKKGSQLDIKLFSL